MHCEESCSAELPGTDDGLIGDTVDGNGIECVDGDGGNSVKQGSGFCL